jgi:hypothetical protein
VGLIDRIRTTGYVDDGSPALVVGGAIGTIADAARRVLAGSELLLEARDLLDQLPRASDDALRTATAERPGGVSQRADALFAAIAEDQHARRGLGGPPWATDPGRFLEELWFVSEVPGFRAIAIARSPIAYKRRGIMWAEESLRRV